MEEILARIGAKNNAEIAFDSVSYYPSKDSSWHQSPKIKALKAENVFINEACPLHQCMAKGWVEIKHAGPFYILRLNLDEIKEYVPDLVYGRGIHLDLANYDIPKSVLAPSFHIIQLVRPQNPPLGSIYTVDLEGSSWSIHLTGPKTE